MDHHSSASLINVMYLYLLNYNFFSDPPAVFRCVASYGRAKQGHRRDMTKEGRKEVRDRFGNDSV